MNKYTIDNKTYDTIKKYNGEYEATLFKNKLDALENTVVTVTNTGIVSSGKSSLFNALLDRFENERFSVGAARTTVDKDTEELLPGIELVDTPGIDVKEQDDQTALNAICASSIIIMVHNIKMGMLHQNEVDWLKNIRSSFSDTKELKDRFIFVNSWVDQRMNEKSFEDTVNETKRILYDIMGTDEIECYNVSSVLYVKGLTAGKEKLAEISGIPELRSAVIEKARLYNKEYGFKKKKSEVLSLVDKNTDVLSRNRKNKNIEKYGVVKRVEQEFDVKKKKWENALTQYKQEMNEYKKITTY